MGRTLDIVLFDEDEEYVSRLAGAIGEIKGHICNVYAFSKTDKAILYMKGKKPDVLIVTESSDSKMISECVAGRIITITQEDGNEGICKYSSVHKIISAVLKDEEVPEKTEKPENSDAASVTGVFSFCETGMKTGYALSLAKIASYEDRVLYINLDEFSGLGQEFKSPDGYDLSDLFYFYRQNRDECIEKFSRSVSRPDGFDCICPTQCADDLSVLTPEEIDNFICDISKAKGMPYMKVCGREVLFRIRFRRKKKTKPVWVYGHLTLCKKHLSVK